MRARAALAFTIVVPLVWASASASAAPRTAAGVAFDVPEGAEVTEQEGLPEGVQVVAITHGDEVLLLTVYRGERAPKQKAALTAHVEELERQVSGAAPVEARTIWRRLLGKSREGREIRYRDRERGHVATVLAAARNGTTLVAAWTTPEGQRGKGFSWALVKEISLAE